MLRGSHGTAGLTFSGPPDEGAPGRDDLARGWNRDGADISGFLEKY